MRMSLLDMTQAILSALDSDEINSIGDSVEAQQVALTIKMVYNDIISRANLPEHFDLFELNASGDPTKPLIMYRPDSMKSLLWLKYDKRLDGEPNSDFQVVTFLEPEEFLRRMNGYQEQPPVNLIEFTVNTSNSSSMVIRGFDNKAPDWYTCWDDNLIVFDSYDSVLDGTLMKNKSMAYGEVEPVFTMTDAFVPDLDSRQFSLLFNEAKAMCFAELKQTEHSRAERNAKRGWVTLAHQKNDIPADYPFFKTLPNYGRKR